MNRKTDIANSSGNVETLPPHDLEAEREVLGAILAQPAEIERIRALGVSRETFYRPSHGIVFETAASMHTRGDTVTSITVVEELRRLGLLGELDESPERSRGMVHGLASSVTSVFAAPAYAQLIVQKARQRTVLREARQLLDHSLNGGATLEDVEAAIGAMRAALLPGAAGPRAVSLAEFIESDDETPPALLGDGVLPAAGFVILGGQAGSGKTTLLLDFAFHAAAGVAWLGMSIPRPLNVLVIENEGPIAQFREKLRAKRDVWRERLVGDVAIWIDRWGAVSLADAQSAAAVRKEIEDRRVDVVIADPLASLGVEGVGSPAETQDFVNRLRTSGLLDHAAWWFLAHFRKEPTTDELDQLAGSWRQHADTVLSLRAADTDHAKLTFGKLRWASQRQPLILRRDVDTASFSVVGEGEVAARDLDAEILDLLEASPHCFEGKWGWTLSELAHKDAIGAQRKAILTALERLEADARVRSCDGPPGRQKTAHCWSLYGTLYNPVQAHDPGSSAGACMASPSLPEGEGMLVQAANPRLSSSLYEPTDEDVERWREMVASPADSQPTADSQCEGAPTDVSGGGRSDSVSGGAE